MEGLLEGRLSGFAGAGLILLAGAVPPPQDEAAGAERLAAGLEQLDERLRDGRWEGAERLVRELLAEHGARPYALARRSDLVDGLQEALFRQAYESPSPEELVSGELRRYRESTGELEIRYDGEALDDLDRQLVPAGDGGRSVRVYAFPAVFTRAYEIRLSGEAWPDAIADEALPPILVFRLDEERTYVVGLGQAAVHRDGHKLWIPATLQLDELGEVTLVDRKLSPARKRQPYVVEARVEARRIEVDLDGERLFEVKLPTRLPANEFGTFGFVGFGQLGALEIEGRVERSWMRRLADGHEGRARSRFERRFDLEGEVPSQLCLEACGAFEERLLLFEEPFGAAALGGRELDDLLPPDEEVSVEVLQDLVERIGDWEAAGEAATLRSYLLCTLNLHLGRLERAREHAERWLADRPGSRAARATLAVLDLAAGREEPACERLEELVWEEPGDPVTAAWYARVLFRCGAWDDLDELLEVAARDERFDAELAQVQDMLGMARRGPRWAETHEVTSRHYVVRSDINERTCREIADHLEGALKRFGARLGAAPKSDRRFEVYVFSGESSYHRYIRRAWSGDGESTAGMYNPDLGQLLVWNVPDRRMLFETVRHEGFHQYLDQVVEDAPIWLNEGLAVYFENAAFRRGPSREIVLHPEHIETLTDGGVELLPVEALLELSPPEFYAEPERNYAEAWALVHYLLNSTRANRGRVEELLEQLREGTDVEAATRAAFDGVDPETLTRDLAGHLRSLRAGAAD
jgi:hypothetical protein